MTWYYAADAQQVGPFTDEQFRDLVTKGTIQPTTLVWQAKLANWIPLSQVHPDVLPPTPAAPRADPPLPPFATPMPRCANCGGQFSADNLVQIENALVCSNCKPIVLHRIKEGANPLGTALTADELVHRVNSEYRTVEVGECFSRAWALFKANFGPVIGVSLLVLFCMAAGGAMPFIGSCISLIITGPLMGGLYLYYLKQFRGQPATIGDAFSGFPNGFAQLMLASVVSSILAYLPLLPFIIYFVARNAGRRGNNFNFGPIDAILLVVGLIAMLYLVIAWLFALPLVIDKQMNFWTAMQVSRRVATRRLGSLIVLMLASIGVVILGVLACFVGLLVAIPLTFAAYAAAYEQLFGERQPVASAPPANG
jgi:hypothetical protein